VFYAKYLGSNEFGVSRGYAQPLEQLWPGITVLESCGAVEEAQGKVKKQMVVDARNALVTRWQHQKEQEAAREAHVQEAEAAAKTITPPEPVRLHVPSVAFGAVSIEYSLPKYAETQPPSTKEFGLFPAGQRGSWYKLGEVQGNQQGVLNLDVEGIPPGDYDLGARPPTLILYTFLPPTTSSPPSSLLNLQLLLNFYFAHSICHKTLPMSITPPPLTPPPRNQPNHSNGGCRQGASR